LRQDEEALDAQAEFTTSVTTLREMPAALQTRALQKLLLHFGLKEPEGTHVELLRGIVCSDNPSASGKFSADVVIAREYDQLIKLEEKTAIGTWALNCPGKTPIPELGICVIFGEESGVPVCIKGNPVLRSRQEGDRIRLFGGQKSLKKLFIDRKIPAGRRPALPVVCDDNGILGVYGIGADCSRMAQQLPALQIRFEQIDNSHRL
jgi:tRNA(Ile)-lysidine synthase